MNYHFIKQHLKNHKTIYQPLLPPLWEHSNLRISVLLYTFIGLIMSGANNRDFDMYDGFLLYTNYIIPQMSNRFAVLNEAVKKSNPIVESAF